MTLIVVPVAKGIISCVAKFKMNLLIPYVTDVISKLAPEFTPALVDTIPTVNTLAPIILPDAVTCVTPKLPTLAFPVTDNAPDVVRLPPDTLPAILNKLLVLLKVRPGTAAALPLSLNVISPLAPGACNVASPVTVTPPPVIVV